MTISIYSSSSSHISINLLEIASNILRNFRFWETYSIEINIEYIWIFEDYTWPKLYITNSGNIVDNDLEVKNIVDSFWIHEEVSVKMNYSKFSATHYNEIIVGKINKWLTSILSKDIKSVINENSILTTFTLPNLSKEEYANKLVNIIRTRIWNRNSDYWGSVIENYLEEQLLNRTKKLWTNSIILNQNNFNEITWYSKSFFEYFHELNNEVIEIFKCDFPDQIFQLCLYSLLFQNRISWFQNILNNKYRIELGSFFNKSIAEWKHNHVILEYDEDLKVFKINDYTHKCTKKQNEYLWFFFDMYEKRIDKIATYEELIWAFDFSLLSWEKEEEKAIQQKSFYNCFAYLNKTINEKSHLDKLFKVDWSWIWLNPDYKFTIK